MCPRRSIAKITVGQPAEMQLDAFPDLRLAGEREPDRADG